MQTQINTKLLRDTLAFIKEHPEQWDQTTWHRGDCYCFAGHAARIADGGTLTFSEKHSVRAGFFFNPATMNIECIYNQTDNYVPEEYRVMLASGTTICRHAGDVLGLIEYERAELFDARNSIEDLERIVNELDPQGAEAPHQPVPPVQQTPPLPQPEPYHPTDEPRPDVRDVPPPHVPPEPRDRLHDLQFHIVESDYAFA